MPTLPSSSFEPSPFTLPIPSFTDSSAAPSASSSTVARRSYRKRQLSESDTAAGADDSERKRRRQEQNRKAASTSRVNNKMKRDRLEQRVTELEEANQRLKRIRQTLADDNSSLNSSTSSAANSSLSPPSSLSTSSRRVRRSSSRESAVLVSLPWNFLQLIHNKPHIQRAITAIIALSVLLVATTALLVLSLSLLQAQPTAPSSRHSLPLSSQTTPFSSSPLPSLLLLSSLLSLTASPLRHFPPSPHFPTLYPASHSSSLPTPLSSLPLLRLSSQRRRLTLSRSSDTATATAMQSVAPVRAGISAESLAGVQLRAGRSVAERVWTRGGVRFRPQLRGTNASVSVNERVGSPPWLLAVLVVTAMVS